MSSNDATDASYDCRAKATVITQDVPRYGRLSIQINWLSTTSQVRVQTLRQLSSIPNDLFSHCCRISGPPYWKWLTGQGGRAEEGCLCLRHQLYQKTPWAAWQIRLNVDDGRQTGTLGSGYNPAHLLLPINSHLYSSSCTPTFYPFHPIGNFRFIFSITKLMLQPWPYPHSCFQENSQRNNYLHCQPLRSYWYFPLLLKIMSNQPVTKKTFTQ